MVRKKRTNIKDTLRFSAVATPGITGGEPLGSISGLPEQGEAPGSASSSGKILELKTVLRPKIGLFRTKHGRGFPLIDMEILNLASNFAWVGIPNHRRPIARSPHDRGIGPDQRS